MNVGIAGLGLMGGSLARDLAAAGWRVTGHDRDPATLRAARDTRVIRATFPLSDDDDTRRALRELDLLVLALPVRAAATVIRALGALIPQDAPVVVTDVGSTKRSAVEAAADAGLSRRFVGGHPLAGDHRSGWGAARAGLFRDAPVWLCPAPDAPHEAVARVESMWRAVGGRPRRIEPAAHDRRVARASHLPQLAATALAGALHDAGIHPPDLGPGGRDATRLAGSDPALWVDILLDNADEVRPALHRLQSSLAALAHALDTHDEEALRTRLTAARAWSRIGPSGRDG